MPGRVANRARPALKPARRLQRFIIGPAGFIAGRPALKRAGFQAGQVYNRALTYTCIIVSKASYASEINAPVSIDIYMLFVESVEISDL